MDVSFGSLPNELKIKIFSNFTIDDMKRYYYNLKDFKDILDYIIKKNNYGFIGKLELLYDIIFMYYQDAYTKISREYYLYSDMIENIYNNRDISIKLWKIRCNQNGFNLSYMPEVLKIVLDEYQTRYTMGCFDPKRCKIEEVHGILFLHALITYLNH